METIISTMVFVYAIEEIVVIFKSLSDDDVLRLDVVACTGCAVWCAVWTGVFHSFCSSRVEGSVDNIKSINERGTNRPGLVDVDLFEYDDVIPIGLRISKVIYFRMDFVPIAFSYVAILFYDCIGGIFPRIFPGEPLAHCCRLSPFSVGGLLHVVAVRRS